MNIFLHEKIKYATQPKFLCTGIDIIIKHELVDRVAFLDLQLIFFPHHVFYHTKFIEGSAISVTTLNSILGSQEKLCLTEYVIKKYPNKQIVYRGVKISR